LKRTLKEDNFSLWRRQKEEGREGVMAQAL
jgi:hypothetical protein